MPRSVSRQLSRFEGIILMTTVYRLERVQTFVQPREEVFEFFADAGNLEAITPPFLRFRIVTPLPIEMRPGALIDYRLQLFGIPFGWRTEIETYEPAVRFTDRQLRGPYVLWHHTHEFFDIPDGTLMVDRVNYSLPLGILGSLAYHLFVRTTLDVIFDYRRQKIEQLLAGSAQVACA